MLKIHAPIKSAFGVIMISRNTHYPTGTGSVELYTFGPDSPACGEPSRSRRVCGRPEGSSDLGLVPRAGLEPARPVKVGGF